MSRISKIIERRGWKHSRFILSLTLALSLGPLIFVLILQNLVTKKIISPEVTSELLRTGGISLSTGMLFGIIIGVLLLLRDYIKKQWDLHIVVPKYLILFFFTLIAGIIYGEVTGGYTYEYSTGVYGYGLGGMIPILAYSSEVEREHLESKASP